MRSSASTRSRSVGEHRRTVFSSRARRPDDTGSRCNLVTRKPTYIPDYDTPRFRLTPAHIAYHEDRRGLQSPVHLLRHPADARPASQPHHRVRRRRGRALVAEGVKEINLISQDTTYFGMDLWDAKGRAAPAGRFLARTDARRSCCASSTRSRANSGFACSTRIPAHWSDELIAGDRRMRQGRALHRHAAAAHPRRDARPHAARDQQRAHRRSHRAHPRRHSRHRHPHHFHRRLSRRDRGGVRVLCSISSSARASSGSAFSPTRRRKVRAPRRCRIKFRPESKTRVIAAP